MTQRRPISRGAPIVIVVLLVAGAAAVSLALWRAARNVPAAAAPPATTAATASTAPAGRKIKARLFYVSQDGTRLTSVERDVAYGDGPAAQAQEIVAAQLAPVAAPLLSAVPAGTALRALYLSPKGEAYVDLSREVVAAHTGGSLDELLTVYTIVNALTTNLPAVTVVQVLVDGKEVDTLAGHVDLRRPLARNLDLVE
jgi:germination protein M